MKKTLIFLLTIIVVMTTACLFAGCSTTDSSGLPDLKDCEIGYTMPIYPDYEFDYQVNDECIVHMTNITMTLIEKNTIEKGELLTEEFQPYVFELTATGKTDPKFAGRKIMLNIWASQQYKTRYYYIATVEEDGSINWKEIQDYWSATSYLSFCNIEFL